MRHKEKSTWNPWKRLFLPVFSHGCVRIWCCSGYTRDVGQIWNNLPLNSLLDEIQWSFLLQCFVVCSQRHCSWYYWFQVWLFSKALEILSIVCLFFSQFFSPHYWLHYQFPGSALGRYKLTSSLTVTVLA